MTAFRCVLGVWFVLGLSLSIQATETKIQVNEAGSKATIEQQSLHLELAVTQSSPTILPVSVQLYLLDLNQEKFAEVEFQVKLRPGKSVVPAELALPFDTQDEENLERLLWSRVQYHIQQTRANPPETLAEGIFSVSLVARNIFRLKIQPPLQFTTWKKYRPRVMAVHPTSLKPIPGVKLIAHLADETQLISSTTTSTNQDGYAELNFPSPPAFDRLDPIKLSVTGKIGDISQTTEAEIQHSKYPLMVLMADKTLYSPGDIVEFKWFAVGNNQKRLPGGHWSIQIEKDRQLVFETQQPVSVSGQETLHWHIPSSLEAGDYQVHITAVTGQKKKTYREVPQGLMQLKIVSRPKFLVQVHTDRDVYLTGSTHALTRIQVSQESGLPLVGATVFLEWSEYTAQIVWNHRFHTWARNPHQFLEGQTDDQGRCEIQVPLEQIWKFRNQTLDHRVPLLIHVIHPESKQVVSQQTAIRLEDQKIIIKLVGHLENNIQGQPLQFTIVTTYPDGTPAQCQVDVYQNWEFQNSGFLKPNLIIRTHTNQYGIKRITNFLVYGTYQQGGIFKFQARDAGGIVGEHTAGFNFPTNPVVRIETERSLYREGQPLHVTFRSNYPDLRVWVTVINPLKVILTQLVYLKKGKATLTIPYTSDLSGKVTILTNYEPELPRNETGVVFEYSNSVLFQGVSDKVNLCDGTQDLRSVLYPSIQTIELENLKLVVDQPSNKNGAAGLTVSVKSDPLPDEIFGILVNSHQGIRHWSSIQQKIAFFSPSLSSKLPHTFDQIADWTLLELQKLKPFSQTESSKLDELAEVLLHHTLWDGSTYTVPNENKLAKSSFFTQIDQQCEATRDMLWDVCESGPCPKNESEFKRLAKNNQLNLDTCLDPWGTPYRYDFDRAFIHTAFQIRSAGPDEQFATHDDFIVKETDWYTFDHQLTAKLYAVLDQANAEDKVFLTLEEFKQRALAQGINLDTMTDDWGMPLGLEFRMSHTGFLVMLTSTGPNQKRDSPSESPSDDFLVWQGQTSYVFRHSSPLYSALKKFGLGIGRLPITELEFHQALALNGKSPNQFRDPMGRVFRVKFELRKLTPSGAERWYPVSTPIDPKLLHQRSYEHGIFQISLFSDGIDGQAGTTDDFRVFSSSLLDAISQGEPRLQHPSAMKNYVYGVVLDLEDNPMPGTQVFLTRTYSPNTVETNTTDSQGQFVFPNRTEGEYELRFSPKFISPKIVHPDADLPQYPIRVRIGNGDSSFVQVRLPNPASPKPSRLILAKPMNGVLFGRIADSVTGRSIPLVSIEVENLEGRFKYVTTTSEEGQFLFHDLPAGIYHLTAYKESFQMLDVAQTPVLADHHQELELTMVPNPAVPQIPDSTQLQAIMKKVEHPGSLTGTIQGDSHTALSNALVVATDSKTGFMFRTSTDVAGQYEFSSLPIGEYQIKVSAPQHHDFIAVEVLISAQKKTQLDVELISQTANLHTIDHNPPQGPQPSGCHWTRPVQAGGDGKFRFAEIPSAGRLQNWKLVIVVLMKDGSVRWVLR